MCVCVCVVANLNPLSSPPLLPLLPLSLSPSHPTVAMATLLIDPVPSNTKCYSKPQNLNNQAVVTHSPGEVVAPAEEDDGTRVLALSEACGRRIRLNKIQNHHCPLLEMRFAD